MNKPFWHRSAFYFVIFSINNNYFGDIGEIVLPFISVNLTKAWVSITF